MTDSSTVPSRARFGGGSFSGNGKCNTLHYEPHAIDVAPTLDAVDCLLREAGGSAVARDLVYYVVRKLFKVYVRWDEIVDVF